MKITTAENFRDNLSEMIDELIKSNEQLKVTTEMGNVVVLSEAHYNGITETLKIYSNPQEKEKIIEGLHTTVDDCVSEEEINQNNF
ncbi:prevent-host-death protein [Finegoldia magna]|uniref:type II toxin-antitoxin system Phd/YefM family antitoxin n=1 Tax=Finegoldia magna TaxID=1260 RepID=UPI000B9176EB|nr:type II toxin-antitoxin system Phd/YefM family antitoxin [Finegoldia magna]OXZ33351.1 prevent-host-death protein [Finegoldia magna]